MKYITLKSINIIGNRCEYEFDYPTEFEPYIADKTQKLFFELPEDFDLKSIPQGILSVPFVGSVIGVSMLLGIGIKMPVLDKNFYESIPGIKAAYKKMYPYADLCLDVRAEEIEDCSYTSGGKISVFFTGGVDATSALIEKVNEKPILINIWGGDTSLTDINGRGALEKYISRLTTQIGTDYVFNKSNCRRFFNEPLVEKLLCRIISPDHNHGWWSSIAHILSMTASIAPILYSHHIGVHYIGSGYTLSSKEFSCNNSAMVNSIKIGGCRFEIVDEDLCRADKVQKVVSYCDTHNLNVQYKVCWYSKASENCSHCEKCYRTIAEIVCNHADPNKYGFRIDTKGYKEMHRFIKYNYVSLPFWQASQAIFQKEADYWKKDKNISWILTLDFNNKKRIERHRMLGRIKSVIWRIGKKALGK